MLDPRYILLNLLFHPTSPHPPPLTISLQTRPSSWVPTPQSHFKPVLPLPHFKPVLSPSPSLTSNPYSPMLLGCYSTLYHRKLRSWGDISPSSPPISLQTRSSVPITSMWTIPYPGNWWTRVQQPDKTGRMGLCFEIGSEEWGGLSVFPVGVLFVVERAGWEEEEEGFILEIQN